MGQGLAEIDGLPHSILRLSIQLDLKTSSEYNSCHPFLCIYITNGFTMRLLRFDNDGVGPSQWELINFSYDEIPFYAILSHTWGADSEEITFKDIINGSRDRKNDWQHKPGFQKLKFCHQQAKQDGLRYIWIDTCCIDKTSSAELQESLNSMFRWYKNAARCYVYLSDVSINSSFQSEEDAWLPAFRKSRWFTRGWTLQELIAPSSVVFYTKEGERLGDKRSLENTIYEITGIHRKALQGLEMTHFSIETRRSWARNRRTKRPEDGAYCLQGICNVYLPSMYGWGGEMAMRQLEKEIKGSKIPSGMDNEEAIHVGGASWKNLIALEEDQLSQLDASLNEYTAWFLKQCEVPDSHNRATMSLNASWKMKELLARLGVSYNDESILRGKITTCDEGWALFQDRRESDHRRVCGWLDNRWWMSNDPENYHKGITAATTLVELMIWRGVWKRY